MKTETPAATPPIPDQPVPSGDGFEMVTAPTSPPDAWDTASTYALRTIRQFIRTPQLLVVGAVTSTMSLLIFRYVFGGAIQTKDVKYVDFLIPALAAVSGLFGGGVVGVAEDSDKDRDDGRSEEREPLCATT